MAGDVVVATQVPAIGDQIKGPDAQAIRIVPTNPPQCPLRGAEVAGQSERCPEDLAGWVLVAGLTRALHPDCWVSISARLLPGHACPHYGHTQVLHVPHGRPVGAYGNSKRGGRARAEAVPGP